MRTLETITIVRENGVVQGMTSNVFDVVECSGELGMEVLVTYDSETGAVTGVGGRPRNRKSPNA